MNALTVRFWFAGNDWAANSMQKTRDIEWPNKNEAPLGEYVSYRSDTSPYMFYRGRRVFVLTGGNAQKLPELIEANKGIAALCEMLIGDNWHTISFRATDEK